MKIKLTGTNLNVGGVLVADGEVCDIDDKAGEALIERGLAKKSAGKPKGADGGNQGKPKGADGE